MILTLVANALAEYFARYPTALPYTKQATVLIWPASVYPSGQVSAWYSCRSTEIALTMDPAAVRAWLAS